MSRKRRDFIELDQVLAIERIADCVCEIRHDITRIANAVEELVPKVAKSATLHFTNSKGEKLMPATLLIGQTAQAVYTEWSGLNGTGSALPNAGAPLFSTSDATIATVDAVSGLVTAVAVGTATITGTDSVNGLSGSDIVSDQPIVAQSATVVVTANPIPAAKS